MWCSHNDSRILPISGTRLSTNSSWNCPGRAVCNGQGLIRQIRDTSPGYPQTHRHNQPTLMSMEHISIDRVQELLLHRSTDLTLISRIDREESYDQMTPLPSASGYSRSFRAHGFPWGRLTCPPTPARNAVCHLRKNACALPSLPVVAPHIRSVRKPSRTWAEPVGKTPDHLTMSIIKKCLSKEGIQDHDLGFLAGSHHQEDGSPTCTNRHHAPVQSAGTGAQKRRRTSPASQPLSKLRACHARIPRPPYAVIILSPDERLASAFSSHTPIFTHTRSSCYF
ncbi:hypothetical protein BKA62DRAFT_512569 [Auriculariales sp. MPI-PUGE-AT-0066]|nr:hypothetical protein BKA62DRAFT_512569 [Auriculariales sp. MPI-PUGE-AT-0066]